MKKIIVVGGLGRCGSTMIMRMLHAGGLEVIGNNVSYEDDRTNVITKKDLWLKEAEGKAIKILDLHRHNLPNEFDYKIIWLKRNYAEQAKSIIKFMQMVAQIPVHSNKWKKLIPGLIKDEKNALGKLEMRSIEYGVFEFEDFLSHPMLESVFLKNFLNISLNEEKMAAVIKKRDYKCSEGLDVEIGYLKDAQ